MNLDKNFFVSQKFSVADLEKYRKSAGRGLEIAGASKDPEVMFHFAFMALIKIGIYTLAKTGHRIKSRPGHHQKIIEYLSQAFDSQEILSVGDKMRKDRNLDFYSADLVYSREDAIEYLKFIKGVFNKL